jgi:hypothetical protein
MLTRWQKIGLIAAGILALLFAASFFFPPEYQICTPAHDGQAEQCPQYHLGPFVVLWIIRVLDSHNGLVTAIATVFVAGFTWTLWRSSKATIAQAKATGELAEKEFLLAGLQADILTKQKEIARQQYIVSYRPRIEFRYFRLTGGDETPNAPIQIRFQIVNKGMGRATVIGGYARIDFFDQTRLPPPNYLAQSNIEGDVTRPFEIGATDEWVVQSQTRGLTRALETLRPRQLFVFGWVVYADALENTRTTAFCRVYSPVGDRFLPIADPDWEYVD